MLLDIEFGLILCALFLFPTVVDTLDESAWPTLGGSARIASQSASISPGVNAFIIKGSCLILS